MKKRIFEKIIVIIYLIFLININLYNIYAEETNSSITKDVSKSYNLDEYISTINDNVNKIGNENIDFTNIAKDMISGKNGDYSTVISKVIKLFSKELFSTIKGAITIFIIVIIMAIISNFKLEKDSSIAKLSQLTCFIAIVTITITTFLDTISMFKKIIGAITTLMQVISPFLLSILISTGAITSTGIIQPLLLFLASLVGFIVNYIVVPLFTISLAFIVICSISENIKLEKMSKLFTKSSLWIVGVIFTSFLGVLSLETSISSSVDSLSVKTTQAAVSNFVPVVGKFFSDSFESVVGATKIVGKVGGAVGIISVIVIAIVPIIKIASIMIVYITLAALVEPILDNSTISKYLSSLANIYKTLLGVLIGIIILFVISTGIILNLVNSIIV